MAIVHQQRASARRMLACIGGSASNGVCNAPPWSWWKAFVRSSIAHVIGIAVRSHG